MKANPTEQSFFGHLDELVKRFFRCCAALLLSACVIYRYIDPLLSFLLEPVGTVIFTNPSDAFTARIQLSLWVGGFIALPYILYEIWQFAAGALREQEKRYIKFYGPLSFLFFLLGALFAYVIVIPFTMKFFLGFASNQMVAMITIKNYISFVGTMLLGFGVTFELPLILMFLAKIGIATPEFLRQQRRYAIVIILIVSAIITPPDLISLWLMSVPLILLYELGILMIQWSKQHAPSPTYESAS